MPRGISCKHWNAQERQALRDDVPRLGFKARIRDRYLFEIAKECLVLAHAGLRRRAMSIISAATNRGISIRWIGSSMPAAPRPRRCWKNSTAPGSGSVEPAYEEYAF